MSIGFIANWGNPWSLWTSKKNDNDNSSNNNNNNNNNDNNNNSVEAP